MKNRMAVLGQAAPHFYWVSNGYHNFDIHIQDVLVATRNFAALVRQGGGKVNEEVLEAAALLHDMGYALPYKDLFYLDETGQRKTFAVKEDFHRFLARKLLHQIGFPDDFIAKVDVAIAATAADASPTTLEGSILAAADIRGVANTDFPTFLRTTQILHQEEEDLSGKTVPYPKFVRGSVNLLGLYATRRLCLSPSYFNSEGQSRWHLGLLANLFNLIETTWPTETFRRVLDLGGTDPSVAAHGLVPEFDDHSIYLVVRTTEAKRRQLLAQVVTHFAQVGMGAPFMIGVPEELRVISVPASSLDEIYLQVGQSNVYAEGNFPILQLRQALKKGGSLHLYQKGGLRRNELSSPVARWLRQGNFDFSHSDAKAYGGELVYTLR